MNNRIIIGLMGTIGSGKTYVSDYLIKKYNFFKISMGDLVRERTTSLGILHYRENLRKIANDYREKYGETYWIKEVFKKIKSSNKNYFLIDGIRTPIEAKIARDNKAILILIDAKPTLRYKRMIKRAREGEGRITIKELKDEDEKEIKMFGLKKTFSYADYRVYNNSTKEELKKMIDRLISKVLSC